ncbi:hypothetical protein FACS189454_05200 [Planctomycetales bacterium]|nr:hypothetical protein FACS189454_05200 [Planctomycetales bacterium]
MTRYIAFLFIVFAVSISAREISAQDPNYVPPMPAGINAAGTAINTAANNVTNAPTDSAANFVSPTPVSVASVQTPVVNASVQTMPASAAMNFPIASKDSVLGERIARISATLDKLPQEEGQMWREFDITPYTRRAFPAGTQKPEQTIVDWILRQTGTELWHTAPFGILTADAEKLCVYHTKEVQLIVADIVDRFIYPQLWNDYCTLRVVSVSRPDWLVKNHQNLKPIPIASQGVQGWILEKPAAQLLIQELSQRLDFRELVPVQSQIQDGVPQRYTAKRQRNYVRDAQANPALLNGYAEDRVAMDEGFSLSFVPLSMLDQQSIAVSVKLDIVQIEKMLSAMIEVPTASNPRQRINIESPQVGAFKLDEMIRFPKNRVLLLDLGVIPMPNTVADESSPNILSEITKGITSTKRGNVLVFIESTSANVLPTIQSAPAVPQVPLQGPTRTANPLWQGIR